MNFDLSVGKVVEKVDETKLCETGKHGVGKQVMKYLSFLLVNFYL